MQLDRRPSERLLLLRFAFHAASPPRGFRLGRPTWWLIRARRAIGVAYGEARRLLLGANLEVISCLLLPASYLLPPLHRPPATPTPLFIFLGQRSRGRAA